MPVRISQLVHVEIVICELFLKNRNRITWMSKNKNKQRKNVNIYMYLPIYLNVHFGKEPSHWGGSFEYPQDMLWLRNKKTYFELPTLIKGSGENGSSAI